MSFYKKDYPLFIGLMIIMASFLTRFLNQDAALCFVVGGFSSKICTLIGRKAKTRSPSFFKVIAASTITGISLLLIGLGCIGLLLKYLSDGTTIEALNSFAFGAALTTLFAHEDVKKISSINFESYVCAIAATMYIGSTFQGLANQGIIIPLYMAAIGFLSSLMGILTFILFHKQLPNFSQKLSYLIGSLSFCLGIYQLLSNFDFESVFPIKHALLYASLLGVFFSLIIQLVISYFLSAQPPSKSMRIIYNLLTLLFIFCTLYFAYSFCGAYGIGLAAVGMLSTKGLKVTLQKFHQIEWAKSDLPEQKISNFPLGLEIASGSVISWVLFFAYSVSIGLGRLTIADNRVSMGFLIGMAMAFFIGKTQVEFELKGRKKKIIFPAIGALIIPVALGFGLGRETLGGALAGIISMATLDALFMLEKNDRALHILLKMTAIMAIVMAPLL